MAGRASAAVCRPGSRHHGLIANGLAAYRSRTVCSLAEIYFEVAFPVLPSQYTPGMAYAVRTYGRDGWGREFAFESLVMERYRVTSAGPDGKFGTVDDLVFVTPHRATNWEECVPGVYVRRYAGCQTGFVHHVDDLDFRFHRPTEAREAIGCNRFDLFHFKDLCGWSTLEPQHPGELQHRALTAIAQHQRRQGTTADADSDVLLFVTTSRSHDH